MVREDSDRTAPVPRRWKRPGTGQWATIIRTFFRIDAIPLATSIVRERIDNIGNERVRRGLTLLAAPVLGGVEILTDEDPDNANQAETILDNFILDPETQEFVIAELAVPVLENVIKDPLILSFVLEALEQGVEQGAIELAGIEVFIVVVPSMPSPLPRSVLSPLLN